MMKIYIIGTPGKKIRLRHIKKMIDYMHNQFNIVDEKGGYGMSYVFEGMKCDRVGKLYHIVWEN